MRRNLKHLVQFHGFPAHMFDMMFSRWLYYWTWLTRWISCCSKHGDRTGSFLLLQNLKWSMKPWGFRRIRRNRRWIIRQTYDRLLRQNYGDEKSCTGMVWRQVWSISICNFTMNHLHLDIVSTLVRWTEVFQRRWTTFTRCSKVSLIVAASYQYHMQHVSACLFFFTKQHILDHDQPPT